MLRLFFKAVGGLRGRRSFVAGHLGARWPPQVWKTVLSFREVSSRRSRRGSPPAEATPKHPELRGPLGRGRGAPGCVPRSSLPPSPAPRHQPGPHFCKQNVTGDQGARSHRPPMRPQARGQREERLGRVRQAARRRVLRLGFHPRRPPAARRPHPPSSEPPGHARSAGGGDPRAPAALRSPRAPALPSAYLRSGSPAAAPGAGLRGLSTGAAARRARSGRGPARLLPGLAAGAAHRRSQPSAPRHRRSGSDSDSSRPWSGRQFCPGVCTPNPLPTWSADPVATATSLFLLPRPRTRLFDLPA